MLPRSHALSSTASTAADDNAPLADAPAGAVVAALPAPPKPCKGRPRPLRSLKAALGATAKLLAPRKGRSSEDLRDSGAAASAAAETARSAGNTTGVATGSRACWAAAAARLGKNSDCKAALGKLPPRRSGDVVGLERQSKVMQAQGLTCQVGYSLLLVGCRFRGWSNARADFGPSRQQRGQSREAVKGVGVQARRPARRCGKV